MVQYRYAFNSSNAVVTAESLAGTQITDTYSCIACAKPLVARVNGQVRRPHFGHKFQGECNGETYLHRLAKRVFEDTYRNCLSEGLPFTISLTSPRVCDKFKQLTGRICELGEETHEYDLTQYYSELRVETRDGQFIPDISLHSVERPDDIIYVEIAVSHFLSEKKASCGNRVIEIPVESEKDIDMIRNAKLTPDNASFIGFHPEAGVVPDAECKCSRERVFAFYVFSSGKAYLDQGQLQSLRSRIQRKAHSLCYFNIIQDSNKFSESGFPEMVRGDLFVEQVHLAHKRGVPIKSCYLCRYHGNNWSVLTDDSIFCKTYNKPCNSNEAAECDRYRLQKTK